VFQETAEDGVLQVAGAAPACMAHPAIVFRLDPRGRLGTGDDRLPPAAAGQLACQLGTQARVQAAMHLADVTEHALPDRGQEQRFDALSAAAIAHDDTGKVTTRLDFPPDRGAFPGPIATPLHLRHHSFMPLRHHLLVERPAPADHAIRDRQHRLLEGLDQLA
jgi:hypothetical protein